MLGYESLDGFIDAVVPEDIRLAPPARPAPQPQRARGAAGAARASPSQNRLFRSYIGMGYYGTFTPQVIQRNILENPGWYTAYTPYQAEIAQGRLEALLNFQTMVSDLTGLPVANASLLDEATAAAEAMDLTLAVKRVTGNPVYLVDEGCHPQTIAVVQTRAEARGVDGAGGARGGVRASSRDVIGCLVQYPATDGGIRRLPRSSASGPTRPAPWSRSATDLLALTLLVPRRASGAPTSRSATSQRFGVPMGYGGPHAAFFATRDEYKRHMPGRIIGVSKDTSGRLALRMALQTREQHIRRDKATSNVCTAQVLLAVMASMYAVYHGPEGLRRIAERVHTQAAMLAAALRRLRYQIVHEHFFDTVCVEVRPANLPRILDAARARQDQPAGARQPPPLGGAGRDRLGRRPLRPDLDLLAGRGPAATCWATSRPIREPAIPDAAPPDLPLPDPSASSTAATARRRCCATSSGWRPRTSRSPRR